MIRRWLLERNPRHHAGLASWGCHTCDQRGVVTMHYGAWVWLARARSIRHEHDTHGFSWYDDGRSLP